MSHLHPEYPLEGLQRLQRHYDQNEGLFPGDQTKQEEDSKQLDVDQLHLWNELPSRDETFQVLEVALEGLERRTQKRHQTFWR